MTPPRPSRLVAGPGGPLELLVTGGGEPTTVLAHGLAGSIAETRTFGSGVQGTRAFFHFRGHGASYTPEDHWDYGGLAAEADAVADVVGATRALGVSLGAGALLRLVADDPARFERLVLVLPASIDRPRDDAATAVLTEQAELVDDRDVDGLAASVLAQQPRAVRAHPDAWAWARRHAATLAGTSVSRALRELAGQHPLEDRSVLARVDLPVLVIGQEDDPLHPAATAAELGRALPRAHVQVLPPGGVLWSHRHRVRELVAGFLNVR